MADSFQNEVPKARINLKLSLHTGGSPLVISVMEKIIDHWPSARK